MTFNRQVNFRLFVAALFLPLGLVGCSDNAFLGIGDGEGDSGTFGSQSDPAVVDMSEFDQGCETGAECILVNPQACMECNTNCLRTEGLRSKELPAFEEAKAELEEKCEDRSQRFCNNDCSPMRPVCLEGRCTILRDFERVPRACTVDSDCLAISSYVIDECWPESCPDLAVNKKDWETVAGIDCEEQERAEPADPDSCGPPTIPTCVDGQCVLSD